jgi:hypothetical protein
MQYDPIEQLKKCREITPDPAYLARSRRVLLAATPASTRVWFSLPALRLAGVFAVLAAVLATSPFLFPTKPVLSSSLNADSIREEIKNTIAIQVQEITYEQETDAAITRAIDEIKNTETKHLNADVIVNEVDEFSLEDDATTSEIDALLEQVME